MGLGGVVFGAAGVDRALADHAPTVLVVGGFAFGAEYAWAIAVKMFIANRTLGRLWKQRRFCGGMTWW